MLYVSTRNRTEVYTAHRALHENRAPDGGMFVPFRLVTYGAEELAQFQEKSFGDTVAHILNLFFAVRLSSWDVDSCIGRNPVRLVPLGRRTIVGEIWHNPEAVYSYIEKSLYGKMSGSTDTTTAWAGIAIKIAVLFGVFGELSRLGISAFDIALTAGDFLLPMAAWYARKMGLPVGVIICGSNENGNLWDLLYRGELNTGSTAVKTQLPLLNMDYSEGLERLIFGTLGVEEVIRYLQAFEKGGVYRLQDAAGLSKLNDKLYASVVGTRRIDSVIGSVYRTNDYIMDPYTALSYGGLQDYRAKTGENRMTLLLAENSSHRFTSRIADAIGMTEKDLVNRLNSPKE